MRSSEKLKNNIVYLLKGFKAFLFMKLWSMWFLLISIGFLVLIGVLVYNAVLYEIPQCYDALEECVKARTEYTFYYINWTDPLTGEEERIYQYSAICTRACYGICKVCNCSRQVVANQT